MLMALVPSVAAIPSNLFSVAASREPPNSYSRPSEPSHDRSKTTTSARASVSLRNFQDIEHGLRGNAFDAIVTNFSAQPF
jgi:hypothetical protein